MKIKNLAFFGIMAAIMGVAGTARADTTTVIASQAYVDAKDALKQDNAKRIQTTKSAYDGLNRSADEKKEDYPSMFTLEDSITAIGSDNFATKDLDNLTATGKANVSAQGTYDSETNYANGTVGKAIKALNEGKQDNLTFDTTPTADSGNPVTSGGVKTALDTKQDNLGGNGQNGKVVTATNTAGTVTYTSIDNTVAANSPNLVTSGAVAAAIGDASTAVNDAFTENALDERGLESADNLAKVASIQATVARQGTFEKTWNDEFAAEETEEFGATNLYNVNATNAETRDNFVPTVAAVEARVQSAINEATQAAGDNAASTYQTKSDSNVASNGNYITAGQGVGANLVALDTRAKTNADNIATNTASITTLNGNVNTDGSVLKAIKDNAENATFTPGNSGITATNLADAIKEVKTTAASGISGLDVTDANGDGRPVVRVNQADGIIEPIRGQISYEKGLEYKLSNINTAGGDGSVACVKGSPCTLTMFMNDGKPVYEWTNMDTESTDAVM